MGQAGFDGVVGAQYVDVYYCFEGVWRELCERGEEVSCCAGSAGRITLAACEVFGYGEEQSDREECRA